MRELSYDVLVVARALKPLFNDEVHSLSKGLFPIHGDILCSTLYSYLTFHLIKSPWIETVVANRLYI